MRNLVLKTLVLGIIVSAAYAGLSGSTETDNDQAPVSNQKQKTYEPAGKFVPTEKLGAGDAVAFPVDI